MRRFVLAVVLATAAAAQAQDAARSPNVLVLQAGASYDRGGVNLGVGYRRELGPRFLLGVMAEYNPWFDLLSASVETGAANLYATAGVRWFKTPEVELRSSLGLGGTVLLFDVGGPHAGATGLYLSGSVLSAAVRLSPRWDLEIKPDAVAMVPQLRGTPLVYHEYRLTFGFERH